MVRSSALRLAAAGGIEDGVKVAGQKCPQVVFVAKCPNGHSTDLGIVP
ncbi:hypothetical protein BN2364_2949 [Alloalcanivorax xenomutans]|nr:hypothetical protein BN2364_2949 [Alloalcanivorax xenomutans]